jgi:hypothetical protein
MFSSMTKTAYGSGDTNFCHEVFLSGILPVPVLIDRIRHPDQPGRVFDLFKQFQCRKELNPVLRRIAQGLEQRSRSLCKSGVFVRAYSISCAALRVPTAQTCTSSAATTISAKVEGSGTGVAKKLCSLGWPLITVT